MSLKADVTKTHITADKMPLDKGDFLPFTRPDIGEEEIAAAVECLRSGWIATGPRVQALETAFKDYLNVPHAALLTSATAGLHLGLLALGVREGDEVITTPLTFISSVNAIVHAGGRPVMVDIDPKTLNMDVNLLEKAITPKTKVILPVHFAGLPVDLDPLYEIANRHGLRVLEDAAHAVGARYKGRPIGSFGDTQVFSFHPCKNMTTAEGGCLVTRDDDVAKRLTRLRFHGIDRDAWNRYSKEGSQVFDVVEAGYKANMSDLQAAIGLAQLPKLENFCTKRRAHAARYQELLNDMEAFSRPEAPSYDHDHAWHIYTPLIHPDKAGMDRDTFVAKMKEANIGLGIHYPAVHLFSYYQENYGFELGDFPYAESAGHRIMSLPLWASMTSSDQDRVIQTMKKVIGNR